MSVHTCYGVPHPANGRGGVPIPRHPRQVQVRGTPSSLWGGTPPQVWMGGYPIPGLDRGRTISQVQYWMGYPPPPAITGWGNPPCPGLDGVPFSPPIRQSSKASTCYVAGGMPLAFTQEDFLVFHKNLPVYVAVFVTNVFLRNKSVGYSQVHVITELVAGRTSVIF